MDNISNNTMDRSTERIALTKENYAQHLPITPIAFSVAEGGAMGSPGQVIIVDEKLKLYDFLLYEMEECYTREIIPALFECRLRVLGYDTPAPNWKNVYLGYGNHLMVSVSIYDEFSKIVKDRRTYAGDLYNQWISIVQEIITPRLLK